MQVIRIEVGHEPRLIEMENTLKAFQEAVGGYIETVTLERTGLVVIVNEEGKLMGLPLNGMLNIGRLIGEPLAGTVLVARVDYETEDFSGVRACDLGLIQDCWVPFVDHRGA